MQIMLKDFTIIAIKYQSNSNCISYINVSIWVEVSTKNEV